MKYRNYIMIVTLFTIAVSATYGQQDKKDGAIFYFVDAVCENCLVGQGTSPGNYWLVTNQVFQTAKLNTDSILSSFKQQVKKQYPFLTDGYLKTTVIRWQGSLADINTSLENKRKKMLDKKFSTLKIE